MLLIINHKQCNPREKVTHCLSLAFTHEKYTESNVSFMSSTHFNLFADKCSMSSRAFSFMLYVSVLHLMRKLSIAFLIEFNNCPTRCDSFSLLYFCRQLYMFRMLTPIIRSLYNCNYSFWY